MSRLFSSPTHKSMTSPRKACPVVVRQKQGRLEILAFRHPIAGCQLVKGSIEAGEEAGRAALRELCEESGICDAGINSFLGTIQVEPDQEWHLFVCSTGVLPDTWTHRCEDDGGHEFEFFWHSMERPLGDEWHPAFIQPMNFIRRNIQR
jgi:8-oxo-dGTP pyrophosphatase MutT (NUDIX family)